MANGMKGKSILYCPHCHMSWPLQANFCGGCGTALPGRKLRPTWQDELYGLLMRQKPTQENIHLAVLAVSGWLGDKAGSDNEFEALLKEAVAELEMYSTQGAA
jgi:hypothetical protein